MAQDITVKPFLVSNNHLKGGKDEKVHLTSLLEANIHSTIVHNILSELSEEDKKVFLKNLVNNKHQKTLDHLGAKIEKLEDKIKKSVEDLKKELLKDLVQAQKN